MTTPTSGAADLRTAAQAVVDRWDTPLWKDVPATAEYIGRLRAALAAGQATAAKAVVPTGFLHHVIALCTQRGYSPESIEAWSTDHKWIADLWRQAAQMLAAAPAQPAAPQGVAYAALPESFLEIPDVQDESGINAYYSREVVLECIDAALASHGQAPAGATELAEADRRAGAAERKLAASKEDVARIERVRDKMKDQWGVDRRVSFDVVWAEALALKAGTKSDSGVQEDAADPLQGAANWLAEAHGQFSPVVLSGCLMIGYNRAKRLHDAALAARKQGANHAR